jgi:hypothetical protein
MADQKCTICNKETEELRHCNDCNHIFCYKCMKNNFFERNVDRGQVFLPPDHNFCPECESKNITLLP